MDGATTIRPCSRVWASSGCARTRASRSREIGALLAGSDDPRGWRKAAAAKLDELDEGLHRLQTMRARLEAALACGCADLDHCGLVGDASKRRRDTSGGRPGAAHDREAR